MSRISLARVNLEDLAIDPLGCGQLSVLMVVKRNCQSFGNGCHRKARRSRDRVRLLQNEEPRHPETAFIGRRSAARSNLIGKGQGGCAKGSTARQDAKKPAVR